MHGSPDEQLRTFYYQGRIYQNRGDDNQAMKSFLNAAEVKGELHDTLLYANLLVAQACCTSSNTKSPNTSTTT